MSHDDIAFALAVLGFIFVLCVIVGIFKKNRRK